MAKRGRKSNAVAAADRELQPAARAPPQSPQKSASETQFDPTDMGSIVAQTGKALGSLKGALADMHEDKMAMFISRGLESFKDVVDAAIKALPEEQPPQTVYDASDYDTAQPETVLAGAPATKQEMVNSHNEIESALSVVRTLLSDVRETLLVLNDDDIDDLAKASLTVANIGIRHATNAYEQLADSCGIALPIEQEQQEKSSSKIKNSTSTSSTKQIKASTASITPTDTTSSNTDDSSANDRSIRSNKVLWDPLAPQLYKQAFILSESAKSQPIRSLAVTAACLPLASFIGVFIAPTVLLTDSVLQWGVDTPIGHKVEKTASEALEVAKLWYLVGKISAKQSLRFVTKEFKRTGGIHGIVNASSSIVSNPVESVKSGLAWSKIAAVGTWSNAMWIKDMLTQSQGAQ